MKLLSICIPTYNRSEQLGGLSKSFLVRALDEYGDHIEVVVSDNSDDSFSRANRASLDRRIRYSKNETNLGYSGNIRRCINLAEGQYLWIISDDDAVLWDGFVELMSRLLSKSGNKPDVYFAPITTLTVHGEKLVINGDYEWGCRDECRFGDILANGRIPFLFIASGIIKNGFDGNKLDGISEIENDYLHVLMYCSTLTAASTVAFLAESLVEYKTSKRVRFSIYSISKSIQFLVEYIHENFHIKIRYSAIYSEHLKWLLYHRAGMSNVYKGDADRWKLMRSLPKNISARNVALCMALLLPKKMVRAIFVCYYAWRAVRKSGNPSIGTFFRSLSSYWNGISRPTSD